MSLIQQRFNDQVVLEVDYLREYGSLLTHLSAPKTRLENIFCIYD